MRWWQDIADLLERDGYCASVTVVASKGSAPREPGARLVVRADGNHTGSIGGGALEWQAIAEARRMMDQKVSRAKISRTALGPNLGQCCGGSVQLLTEVFSAGQMPHVKALVAAERQGGFRTDAKITESGLERRISERPAQTGPRQACLAFDGKTLQEMFTDERRQVLLFGAGHIGRALVLALAPLPFSVVWLDSRGDMFPRHAPANVVPTLLTDSRAALTSADAGAFVVVMTHSHALDLDIVSSALPNPSFDYVGLIGSATKCERFRKRMSSAGMEGKDIDKLVCPIGVDGINSKQPAAIAAAVASQLLIYNER